MKARVGDKVRVKKDGIRGILESVNGRTVRILLQGGMPVELDQDEVTNFSLAARKAWKTEPARRVGRPKGLRIRDRVSVTLRIDREVWTEFQQKEKSGKIDDRSNTINNWLREKLAELDRCGR